MQVKYGFLYSNYTTSHPYWETTEMLRKFIFAFIPVRAPLALQVLQVFGSGRGSAPVWAQRLEEGRDWASKPGQAPLFL